MKLFESQNPAVRIYLHLSYALSMALMTLVIREFVSMRIDAADISQSINPVNLISLLVATAVISLMLYLHLPKMINRCYTIGRHFGL